MKSSLSLTRITLLISLLLCSTSFPYITLASQHTTTFIKSTCTQSLFKGLTEARSASQFINHLIKTHGLRPKEAAALSICNMAVRYAVEELQRAFEEMDKGPESGPTSEMVVSNVLTWTSTALTYEGNCMDGFKGKETNGNVKIMVTRQIKKLSELTSNSLALVSGYASRRNHHHHDSNP